MASLEDAFRPLAYRGGWANSPTLGTSPKPSIEMGPVTVSPRQPMDPMRFNGANMVPLPEERYADSRMGPSTYSQKLDMTDPNVRQLARVIVSDLDSRGMLRRPGTIESVPQVSVPVIEDFSVEDARDKISELMGNSAFVIGIFLVIFGSTIKNMGLLIVGAVFLGVPGAMGVLKSVANYAYDYSGVQKHFR